MRSSTSRGSNPTPSSVKLPREICSSPWSRLLRTRVMAGCKVEYMPLVLAASRAFLDPLANAHCVAATLGGAQVSSSSSTGRRAGNSGCSPARAWFGPGSRANATIGRAVRLVVRNCARSIPGEADRAAFSTPARFSFCIGEDEEGSAWLHCTSSAASAGTNSVVTLNSMTDAYALYDDASAVPETFLDRLAHLCRCRPVNADAFLGDSRTMLLVVGPEPPPAALRRWMVEGRRSQTTCSRSSRRRTAARIRSTATGFTRRVDPQRAPSSYPRQSAFFWSLPAAKEVISAGRCSLTSPRGIGCCRIGSLRAATQGFNPKT